MAIEVQDGATREVVTVSWDMEAINGEFVQVFCVNPDNGDKSNTGIHRNQGSATITYPEGYTGTTEITVLDNHGNTDDAVIAVSPDGAVVIDPDAHPEHPIELPDEPIEPSPDDPHVEHPIVIPPPGFNPPDSEFPPHPEPNEPPTEAVPED